MKLAAAGASVNVAASLGIDNRYFNFVSWKNGNSYTDFERLAKQDIPAGFAPMISWSAGDGNGGCVSLLGIASGFYDSTVLADNLALIQGLGSSATVYLRLFYEMTDSPDEGCANPTGSTTIYQEAFQHVVDYFNANLQPGAPNIIWVFAPGEPAFESIGGNPPVWPNYYPGSAYVDVIGEDVYQHHGDAFPGEVCAQTDGYGKPIMISETGAVGATAQVAWLNGVRAQCPGLYAFLYWDAQKTGGPDYTLDESDTSPQGALAAFATLSLQGGVQTRQNKH